MPKPMTEEEQARRKKKTKSVRSIAEQIDTLRAKVRRDLRSDDEKTRLTALAIALMDKTAERVGNDESAGNGHFGVTGWQKKHITFDGDSVTLKYVGKSGVKQDKTFKDKTLAKMLKECAGKKGKTLLTTDDGIQIRSAQVNRYLEEFGVTAKDIRGYRANDILVKMLNARKTPSDPDERKKAFRDVMKEVAAAVGHQQATLKKHYLLPGLEESYVKNGTVRKVKNAAIVSRIAAIANLVSMREVADKYARELLPVVIKEYEKRAGPLRRNISFTVKVADTMPEGKVGSYLHQNKDNPVGELTVSPEVFANERWKHVVLHETIHAVIGDEDGKHGQLFDILSSVMGLPKEYRD